MANNEARVRAEPLDPAANLERKAGRIERLSAENRQFRDSFALEAVVAAKLQPGLRLAQVVRIVMDGYADRPALIGSSKSAGVRSLPPPCRGPLLSAADNSLALVARISALPDLRLRATGGLLQPLDQDCPGRQGRQVLSHVDAGLIQFQQLDLLGFPIILRYRP